MYDTNEKSPNERNWEEFHRIHRELFPEPEKETTWNGIKSLELKYLSTYNVHLEN